MITKNEVLQLYQLILDRVPESEEVINEKRTAETLSAAAAEMLMSEEFIDTNSVLISAYVGNA